METEKADFVVGKVEAAYLEDNLSITVGSWQTICASFGNDSYGGLPSIIRGTLSSPFGALPPAQVGGTGYNCLH